MGIHHYLRWLGGVSVQQFEPREERNEIVERQRETSAEAIEFRFCSQFGRERTGSHPGGIYLGCARTRGNNIKREKHCSLGGGKV